MLPLNTLIDSTCFAAMPWAWRMRNAAAFVKNKDGTGIIPFIEFSSRERRRTLGREPPFFISLLLLIRYYFASNTFKAKIGISSNEILKE